MDTQTWQSEKVHFAILIVNTPKKGDEKWFDFEQSGIFNF
jgi:hypothetical protein